MSETSGVRRPSARPRGVRKAYGPGSRSTAWTSRWRRGGAGPARAERGGQDHARVDRRRACAGRTPGRVRVAGRRRRPRSARGRGATSGSRPRRPVCTSRSAVRDNLQLLRGARRACAGRARRDRIDGGRRRARPGRAPRPAQPRSCRAASAAGCTPRSRSCTGPRWSCSTSRPPARTCGRAPRSSTSCADVAADGSAVVYSTHYLHEVEQLDARVAFIDRGRIVAAATLSPISSAGTAPAPSSSPSTAASPTPHGAKARSWRATRCASRPTTRRRTAGRLLPRLGPDAASLRAIEVIRPDLESVFLARHRPSVRHRASRSGRVSSVRRRIGVDRRTTSCGSRAGTRHPCSC